MIKNNDYKQNKQKNTKTSNYVIQNKLELWSSFLLAFFKLNREKKKKHKKGNKQNNK